MSLFWPLFMLIQCQKEEYNWNCSHYLILLTLSLLQPRNIPFSIRYAKSTSAHSPSASPAGMTSLLTNYHPQECLKDTLNLTQLAITQVCQLFSLYHWACLGSFFNRDSARLPCNMVHRIYMYQHSKGYLNYNNKVWNPLHIHRQILLL